MSLTWNLLLIVALVVLNGVFASAEIAVISLNRSKLRVMAKDGNRRASLVLGFLEDSSRFLATIQIAITLSGFMASAAGAASLARPLGAFLGRVLPWLGHSAEAVAVILVTLAVTYFTLVWGELVPKRLGFQLPQRVAFFLARPVAALAAVFGPINTLLTWSTNVTLRLMGLKPRPPEARLTEDEVKLMVRDQSVIPEAKRRLLGRVFDLGQHLGREIMVPRTEMTSVPARATVAEAMKVAAETGFSRLPVIRRDSDDVVGVVTIKGLAAALTNGQGDEPITGMMKEPLLFPDTKPALALLEEMQKTHQWIVILVDEYGGVAGLVTVEDILEEIVGDLRNPGEPAEFVQRSPREYLIDGGLDIEEVNRRVGAHLDTHEAYETVGGFVVTTLGRLPEEGDQVIHDGLTFRVEKVDGRRVDTVLIVDHRDRLPEN